MRPRRQRCANPSPYPSREGILRSPTTSREVKAAGKSLPLRIGKTKEMASEICAGGGFVGRFIIGGFRAKAAREEERATTRDNADGPGPRRVACPVQSIARAGQAAAVAATRLLRVPRPLVCLFMIFVVAPCESRFLDLLEWQRAVFFCTESARSK